MTSTSTRFGVALALSLALAGSAYAQNEPAPPPAPDTATPPAVDGPPPLPETPPPLPEPPPLPQPDVWIEEAGAPAGPFKPDDLRDRVAAGTLTPTTFAWMAGMDAWTPAAEVSALAPLFAAADPAPQPEPQPAPAPEPQPAAFDAAGFVQGTWVQQGQVQMEGGGIGFAEASLTFAADNTFAIEGTLTTVVIGQGRQEIPLSGSGTYEILPGDGEAFTIVSTGTLTRTLPGMAPMTEQVQDSTLYVRLDEGHMRDPETGEVLTRSGG